MIRKDCFTDEQRPIVYFLVEALAAEINRAHAEFYGSLLSDADKPKAYRKYVSDLVTSHCNLYGPKLKAMDKRPTGGTDVKAIWANKTFFPYVSQCMLEMVIEELKKTPDVERYIIKMLEDAV